MKIYLVGGAVRDKLIPFPYFDKDWVVVGATPEQMLAEGYQAVGKDFPVFLHPQTKEEYALARTERKTGPGYTGFDCHTSPNVSLKEDLLRRDLTINAMAEDDNGQVIDPYGGQQDLRDKILRHVSPAFTEDPLRVLRVARFSARYLHLGFNVADSTLDLLRAICASGELESLPAERIWKELERSLTEKSPAQFFVILEQCGALQRLLPELSPIDFNHFDALHQAVANDCPLPIRFALMLLNSTKTDCQAFCQRIKAPKEYRDLAMLVSSYAQHCSSPSLSPEQLLALVGQLDGLRRPERFADFLQCCDLLFENNNATQQLRRALGVCQQVSARELAAENLSGKDIARELNARRLKAISASICTPAGKEHD